MPTIFGKWFKRKKVGPPAAISLDQLFAQATQAASARDFRGAISLYDQALSLDDSRADAYYKRANALKDLGRLEEALAAYDQAIERKPDYAYAFCNRGVVQQSLGLLEEALRSYDQAIAHDPADAVPHYNRALLMQATYRWEEALAAYDRAIEIDPGYADAQYNRSVLLLFRGRFEQGWQSYDWRWKNAIRLSIGTAREFAEPRWLGETSIAGSRLLLYHEAGLGDTLQFCRYASLCAAEGAQVFLEVQPPLVDLLRSLDGVSQVIPAGSTLPPIDYQCPLMSLPRAFKTTLTTIPAKLPYLRSDAGARARWSEELEEYRRPRVGLAWSGNPNHTNDRRRSIPLVDWTAHLPPGFNYFRLQNHVRGADKYALESSAIISFDDAELDFTNIAALCDCMDLVISVDTSLAHLSGALGRPTWVLLPLIPDWRWLLDRVDSPWYPGMKLYRQTELDDWHEVLKRVAADLREQFPGS